MRKRFFSLFLVLTIFAVAVMPNNVKSEETIDFHGMGDPNLLQYVEDQVYANLAGEFDSEDYVIENVQAVYISEEYLEEYAFNSQANIFFGYTIAELKEEFKDSAYIFTLGKNNETVVEPFVSYDDTYEKLIRNVAIGTGVILVCMTVSMVTGVVGLQTVSLIFAASAKTGTTFALTSGFLGGAAAGVIKGYQTGDVNKALKEAALKGSEGFKWGAISGAVAGGLKELRSIHRAAKAVKGAVQYKPGTVDIPKDAPQWQQAELRALNNYGGSEQLSYLNGKQVAFGTQGATRPDVVRVLGDHVEAIEVKYYDLQQPGCLSTMYKELQREVRDRVINMPKGTTQRIVLDVTGRGYNSGMVDGVKNTIVDLLQDIYHNIPVDIVGL